MAVTITGTRTRTLTTDADGDNQADSGDVYTYEVIVTNADNTPDESATGVELDADQNGYTIGNVKIGPIGVDDDLNAVYGTVAGNTPLTFTAANILGNDLDPDDGTPNLTVTHINGTAIVTGVAIDIGDGTITRNGDGTFTFRPDAGFEGEVNFTYNTVDSDGIASVAATPATVNITVGDAVWYVNSATGSDITGDGTFDKPFASLAPISGGASEALDDANDTIFVYANGANAYNSGIVLESGQILRGEGVAADFVVNGITISSVQTDTQIEYSTFGVELNQNNTIMGIDLVGETNLTAVAIRDNGGSVGTFTASDVEVDGIGQIIDIDNGGNLAVTFQSLTSHGSSGVGGVIDLAGVTGNFTVTGFTTIDTNVGTHNQTGIDIGGAGTTAVFNFSGGTSLNMGASAGANGVVLSTQTGSVNFGGLAIAVQGGNTGFIASDVTTLTVTGAGNSVTTATGQILSLTNVGIGGTDVNFNVLSSSGIVTGNAVNLSNVDANAAGNDVVISNLTVAGATGDGINVSGGSSTNVAINTANINQTTGDGVEINASTGSFSITTGNIGNTNDPGGRAVAVINGTGAVDIDANLTKTTAGQIVEVNGHSSGTVNFGGNLSATGGFDNGILITGSSGNIEFTGGSKVINTGANIGVEITGNSANVSFQNGGLDIDTTNADGIQAGSTTVSTGGTLAITGTGNTVTVVGTGIAVVMNGTDVGSSNITLQSVSKNGTGNGIFLQNTGSSGSFNITGVDGGDVDALPDDNSGGTIQNTGGTNDGIFLNNVSNFNITEMVISNTGGHGIQALNLGGVNTIHDTTIQDYDSGLTATKDAVFLVNNNTNMTSMVVTDSLFDGRASANNGFFMEAQGTSSMNLRVQGSTFQDMFGDGLEIQSIGGSTGTLNIRVLNNIFQNAAASGIAQGNLQMDFVGDANIFADINGNTFVNIMPGNTTLGAIGFTNGGTADADITIRNNIIHDIAGARGITATADGTSTTRMRIDNNQIYDLQENDHGINFNMQGDAVGHVIIENNQLGQAAPLWDTPQSSQAILVQALANGTVFALIQNNTVDAPGTLEIVRVRATETADVDATIINNNIDDTDGASFAEIGVSTGTGVVAGGNIDVSISGNTVNGGRIFLDENTSGDIDVQQASAAAIAAANGGATVIEDGGIAPDYSQPAPTSPTAPTVPVSPLLADPAPPTTGTDTTSQDYGDDVQGNDKPGTTPTPDPDPQPEPDAGPTHPVIVDDGVLSQAELDYLAEAAIQRWADAGATPEQLAAMRSTEFSLADMTGNYLALSQGDVVRVDSDGGGRGWFLDGTPGDDDEYHGSGTLLTADAGGPADGKMDLLSVLMHELGHQVGLDDSYAAGDSDGLMYGYAQVGTRRLPDGDDVAEADLDDSGQTAYVVLTPTIGTLPNDSAVRVVYTATINNFDSQVVGTPFSNNVIIQGTNFSDVPLGADLTTVDTLSIGDLVFLDLNSDGDYDSGTDDEVQGVAVSLYADADNNGTPDGAAIATDTTDAFGLYRFDNLAPGTYIVAIDASNFQSGGALEGRLSITGGTDPDDDADNDDNGVAGTGALAGAIVAGSVTLTDNGEVADDGTGDLDYNDTVDFGFLGVDAQDDAFNTDENTAITTGNVLDDNGSGADSGSTVTAVNGVAGDVGNQITLASGALLTLNSNGTFTYDPNDAFDETPTAGSGASNTPATDSFTYQLDGADTATVTITIAGIDSNDELQGTAGNDVMNGGNGDDDLFGLAGDDQLTGGAGRDLLDGGANGDVVGDAMTGGPGHDTYVVDSLLDTTVEVANQGRDQVLASLSWTLADDVDDLVLTGAGADSGTGNALANAIVGNGQGNTLSGLDGADTLKGNGGDDTLLGGNAGDRLFGGAGADDMQGGAGSDVYNVDNALDTVTELSNEGNDRVETSVSYTIGDNIEDLTLLGAGAINGTGNGDANIITGNGNNNILDGADGNDIIYGAGGQDTLRGGANDDVLKGNDGNDSLFGGDGKDNLFGGAGADGFYFETLNAAFRDKIRDFDATDDTIFLDTSVFTALSTGTLDAGAFVAGTAAGDGDDRIIYDSATGNIYYDADGVGGADQILFANVTAGTAVSNLDFVGY